MARPLFSIFLCGGGKATTRKAEKSGQATQDENNKKHNEIRKNLIPTKLIIIRYNAKSYNTTKHKHTLLLASLLSSE